MLLFFDGFETYASADLLLTYDSYGGVQPTVSASSGRRGTGGITIGWTAPRKSFPANVVAGVIGMAINVAGYPSGDTSILRVLDVSTVQLEVSIKTDGRFVVARNGTVLATSTALVAVGAWHYLEFKYAIDNATGSYELRLDEANILSATGQDTQFTANAYATAFEFGGNTGSGSLIYDDLYALDTTGAAPNNNFLGDVRIDAIYPDGDGNYTQFTPSTGTSHFALVDESTPNTSDYNSDGTSGNKDSYSMTAPPAISSETIFGVRVKVAALKDDAGARSLKVGVRSAAVNSLGAAVALSTSQLYYSSILELDPATGTAWVAAGVAAVETLVETA